MFIFSQEFHTIAKMALITINYFTHKKGLINSIEIYLEGEVHEIISQNIKTKRLFCFLILLNIYKKICLLFISTQLMCQK